MPSILVVEDEDALRDVVAEHLRQAGYEVVAVTGSTAALRELDQHPRFDLVLADVRFPPGQPHGLSLASMIRWRTANTRVLLMTGHPDLVQEAREIDVPAMLKPIRMSVLLEEIGALLAS